MASVTFRQKNADEIIAIVKEAGLDGIEWGGDVHVPPGDLAAAEAVAGKCRENGVEIFSYGSYYRAGEREDFLPVLRTAQALGADTIRVWGGTRNLTELPEEEFRRLAARLGEDAAAARAMRLRVALEYHRGTLTETKEGAAAILNSVPGLFCYWQPNPDITPEEQLLEIETIGPRLADIHVFQWSQGNKAHLLEAGEAQWRVRIQRVRALPGSRRMILEFVQDGSPDHFLRDAAVLKRWAAE